MLCREVVPFSEVGIVQIRSRPHCACWLASPLGFTVWVRPLHAWPSSRIASSPALLERAKQHAIMCMIVRAIVGLSAFGSFFYIHLRSFRSPPVSVVRSREVVRISEVRNTLDVGLKSNRCFSICPFYRGCPRLGGTVREVPLYSPQLDTN